MNHQTRRGLPPVECPLASLGRNTPALDTQTYHHPLSTSPLNPQVYQMSRKSPNLSIDDTDDIIYNSTAAIRHQSVENERRYDTSEIYPLSRSSSNSIDQSSYKICRNLKTTDNNTSAIMITPNNGQQSKVLLSSTSSGIISRKRHHRQNPTTRNYASIDSLLKYQEHPINSSSSSSSYLFENIQNNNEDSSDTGEQECNVNGSTNILVVSHHDQYFLDEKMDSLYIQGAIRSLPLGSETNHYKNDHYYLKDRLNNICPYNEDSDRLHDSVTKHILHRPSSPSDISGSDRFMTNQTRSSPVFTHKSQNNYVSLNAGMDKRLNATKIQCFTTKDLSNLGRFSPSLDQGYATLVSPSPSGYQISGPWNKKESSSRSNSNFDRLSDEAILKIFNWFDSCELCNVARVCRRFESLAWKASMWKTITLRGEHISGDKTLKMIFRRLCGQSRNGACPNVERVMLSEGCRISDKGLQLLTKRCPELTHLQIQSSVDVSNQALCDILTKCTNLQHLDVTGCIQLTSINVHPGLESPRRLLLQYLDLTDCSAINDVGLKVVVKNCPQLTFLYLRRCIQITDAGLKFIPSFCITLKELSVSDCINVTDFGLYELAKLGAALRYLSVAKCDRVSDAGLKVIARRCYKLRYLNARGCEAVSDDSITIVARSCPRLRALDIGKCDVSDAGLRALAESCPNLKKLSVRSCDMITDRGVQCIAYYCRGLQQLNIQDCPVSIEGYRAVKKYCKRCIIEHTNPGFC